MNQRPDCDTIPLQDLLNDDCELEQQIEIEQHLENCASCQSRLSGLAADASLWTQAASHLSTIDDIQLPARLTSHLNASSSMVVPTFDQDSSPSPATVGSCNGDSAWKQILDPPTHPEMLGRIDHFEVESKIGQGGMGIVLKGYDRELNRAVAIKVLAPHLASNGTARRRFAREAQAAAAVMHPNVVPIYSVSSSPARPYIVMQLIPGHSLESLVHESGPLLPLDVVRVALQIASGLAAAHKIGLIHRDVKPGNVLVEREVTRVMITDFGLARAVDDAGLTQTGWLAGTPHYMSPEQSKGDDLDPRTDLFSLGSLMYYVATGREPFRGDKPYAVIQKIITERQTDPMDVNGEIPWMLSDIIEKLLEKDPRKRFQSASELVLVLEQYLAHLQQPTQSKPPRKILTERRKRKRAWMSIGLLAGFAITAAVWSFLPGIGSLLGMKETNHSSSASELVVEPRPSATPRLLPAPAVIPAAAPFGFSFSDDDFAQQLESFAKEIDAFDQSLHRGVPLEFDVTPPSPFFANEPAPFESIESMLDSLETQMAAGVTESELKRLINQDEAQEPQTDSSLPLSKTEVESQPPTKGKNDEE